MVFLVSGELCEGLQYLRELSQRWCEPAADPAPSFRRRGDPQPVFPSLPSDLSLLVV